MLHRAMRMVGCVLLGMVIAGVASIGTVAAQEKSGRQDQNLKPWTFDEAVGQLRMYPRDVYLQYVVMQLGQREGRAAEADAALMHTLGRENVFNQRNRQVDLFSLFSGALAVQESLQLDTMRRPKSKSRRRDSDSASRATGRTTRKARTG